MAKSKFPKRRIAIVAGVKVKHTNFLDENGVRVQVLTVEQARELGEELKVV